MRTMLYILDDKGTPVLATSTMMDREGLLQWCAWMAEADRAGRLRIARDAVDGSEVSTVFLGVSMHGSTQGRPLVFETAIFDSDGQATVIGRRATKKEALHMHLSVLQTLKTRRGRGQEGNPDAAN